MLALLYLIPALMDWMVFFVSFAVFYAAGARGAGLQECAWLGVLFQSAFMAGSFMSGHFITNGNARRGLWTSTLICGIASIGILYLSAFGLLGAGLVVFGVSSAWFFNSFQAFMRGEASVGALKTSVALYTLSWCLGAAMGNVTAGWLYQWGIYVLILAVVLASMVILLLLARPGKHTVDVSLVGEPVESGSRAEYPVSNAYIVVGWLMIFTVTFVQRPLFTFLPPLFATEKITALWTSLPLFMHMAVSAFFGLAMFRFRDFLYRRTPFLIIQGGGAAALCTLWIWPTYWVCFSMLLVLGIYAGFVYYCAVYYASNSGRRAFNTGVNEALVGFGSLAGILIGDAWMRQSGSTTGMYLVCATGLAASTIAQLAVVLFTRKPSDSR